MHQVELGEWQHEVDKMSKESRRLACLSFVEDALKLLSHYLDKVRNFIHLQRGIVPASVPLVHSQHCFECTGGRAEQRPHIRGGPARTTAAVARRSAAAASARQGR